MKYVKPLSLFQEVLKKDGLQQGRLLGLDVGDKYVGLAVSDPHNQIAIPLSVLVRKKTNIHLMAGDFLSLVSDDIIALNGILISRIRNDIVLKYEDEISELSLSGFVVGYPYDKQKKSPNATHVDLLIDDLSKTGLLGRLKYTYWNECFTSKNVELLLKPLNLHPVQSKTMMDKFAAVGILQGYLDYANRNAKEKPDG